MQFSVDNGSLDDVLPLLVAAGIESLTCQPPTLEELFLRQYDGTGAGTESQ